MRRTALLLGVAAIALVTGACGGGDASNDGAPSEPSREVVAAFYPLAFAAEAVGGDAVSVTNLTPPGVEPHDLELSPRDVERVQSADVVLLLGEGFQPAVEDAARTAQGRVVDLLAAVELLAATDDGHGHGDEDEHADEEDHAGEGEPSAEGEHAEEGEHGEESEHSGEDGAETVDPHVWLDPLRYAAVVERIGTELGAQERAAALAGELRALDEEFTQGLADCERRELVASHAAFGYLAERYGLRQIAVTGLEPEAEPAPRELERVVEEVRASGATTVFVEPLVSPELAETVARETGAEVAVLDPLESLSDEQLAAGADYFSVMRDNLAALRAALGCR
jgi:zinc transport system substrate-binding protein